MFSGMGLRKNFVRALRTGSKRIVVNTPNEDDIDRTTAPLKKRAFYDKTMTPLSEMELQRLMIRDQQMNFKRLQTEKDLNHISDDLIEKPFTNFKEDFGSHITDETFETKEAEKEIANKRPKFIKLKDLVLTHPLIEVPTLENQFEKIASAVTPLYQMPYQRQLKIKQRHSEEILKILRRELKNVEAPVSNTFERLPCPLENIIPSPDLLAYRNKDEFSVHVGVDGNPKTVGYFLGRSTDPCMRCIPPTHLVNIRDNHKLLAKHFQAFIRQSPHETCLKFSDGGVWRNIIARSNLEGELMALVTIYPGSLTSEEKERIKHSLADYFIRGPGAECGIVSLYLQACQFSKCTREMAPYELIEGKPHLEEQCRGLRFRISPDSFFQTNTRAAELLYDSIHKVAELSSLTTLLDICCGTGTISVYLAPMCRGAIGIDAISGAIQDAKINAQQNGVKNVSYICGQIEKILPLITRDLEDSADVTAVVNPARSGLHPSVVETIRQCDSIKKLIFVTCKPEGNAMQNMAMLGATANLPRRWHKLGPQKKGTHHLCDPFALRYAIPIDLFPHTVHVEYVFLFERLRT